MADNWSSIECEAIVADYFEMLLMELRGEAFNKSSLRRALSLNLNNRSDGSIQYKYRNIAAILNELDRPYVLGYKPAYNYQKLLRDVVVDRLINASVSIEIATDNVINSDPIIARGVDWDSVLTDAPNFEPAVEPPEKRVFEPVGSYRVSNREQENQILGRKGEELVLKLEKQRLIKAGRGDLALEVEWTSEVRGDGTGYDVRSFDLKKDKELFIEVKTTNFGKYTQFYISPNEVEFSKSRAEQYTLYRVFNFQRSPKLFLLDGNIQNHTNLTPTNYRATFS